MLVKSLFLAVCLVAASPACHHSSEREIRVSANCSGISLTPEEDWFSVPHHTSGSALGPGGGGGGGGGGGCVEIMEALSSLLSSCVTLDLEAGTHRLGHTPGMVVGGVVSGVTDVTLRGSEGGGTIITCEENVGLAFVNVTGLRVSHVTIDDCGWDHKSLQAALGSPQQGGIQTTPYQIPVGPGGVARRVAVLVVGSCRDMGFRNVEVHNTRDGLGLLVENPLGRSEFDNLTLSNNSHQDCCSEGATPTAEGGRDVPCGEVGGGALFLYRDEDEDMTSQGAFSDVGERGRSLEEEEGEIGHMLTISSSTFSGNVGCGGNGLKMPSPTISESGMPLEGEGGGEGGEASGGGGGGGGLSLILQQTHFRVIVTVEGSVFRHNCAGEGGGAYVGIGSGAVEEGSSVSFVDCVFDSNGLGKSGMAEEEEGGGEGGGEESSKIADSAATCMDGGGLAVWMDITEQNARAARSPPSPDMRNSGDSGSSSAGVPDSEGLALAPAAPATTLKIAGTNFTGNSAQRLGGGLLITDSPPPHPAWAASPAGDTVRGSGQQSGNSLPLSEVRWVVENCHFTRNRAAHGSAAYFNRPEACRGETGALLTLTNVSISESTAQKGRRTPFSSSALDIEHTDTEIQGSCIIADNRVTGIHVGDSTIDIREEAWLTISRNTGHSGGGASLEGEGTRIRLGRHAALTFEANTASLLGGGVLFSSKSNKEKVVVIRYASCFLFPPPAGNHTHMPRSQQEMYDLSDQLSQVVFSNNTAPIGAAVYGSTLASCPWVKPSWRPSHGNNVYEALHDESGFIKFEGQQNFSSGVSTLPVKMLVGVDEAVGKNIHPGQTILVNISLYDDFGKMVPSVVQSTTFNNNLLEGMARLGRTGIQLVGDSDTFLDQPRLTLTGRENQTFEVIFVEVLSAITAKLSVTLRPCALGYKFDPFQAACECSEALERTGVTCRDEMSLLVPPNTWLGVIPAEDSADDDGYTALPSTADLVVNKCPLRYCDGTNKTVTFPLHGDYMGGEGGGGGGVAFLNVCAEGSMKTGVLCGGCLANHSAVLGRYGRCLKCGDNRWLALMAAFALAGVLLFVGVGFLQLTVDKGWMYVVLFYCNIVSLYSYLLPISSPLHFFLIPAHLISLQVGYELCFYDGMTTLVHVFLQFAFPLYLYLLMGVFVLLSRRSSWLSQHFSPAQTFLTLFVMSYTSILETCVSGLYWVSLTPIGKGGDGGGGGTVRSTLRWQADANVRYFHGWHAILVLLSAFLLVFYILPLPLLMFYPALAYRHARRFKPFFDAMWAPFQTRFRFWLGVRFVVLIVIYLVAYVNGGGNFGLGLLVFGCLLLVFNQLQSGARPFKDKWINWTDGFLATIVLLLLALSYPTEVSRGSKRGGRGSSEDRVFFMVRFGMACACFVLSYVVVGMIVLWSLGARFGRHWEKMRARCLVSLRACLASVGKGWSQVWGRGRRRSRRRSQRNRFGGGGADDSDGLEMRGVGIALAPPPTTNSIRLEWRPNRARGGGGGGGKGGGSFSQLRETLLETQGSTNK